ncbi:MAG: glycoside hydrolase family 99-like domain-containing protein [Clostridia bacterium]|nr:glycoside hydrolase family 99-like domain-containing protein [Clostridia bacterium]
MKKIFCYYFPNWHIDKRNEKWHGKNWTEWEVTKYAVPRFDGHIQPRKPLWGYIDESKPEVMAEKIDIACEYGIDGFIFDWYWLNEGIYREKCIENGFLKAENCNKLQFGIMLCNHNAIQAHPGSKAFPSPVLEECVIRNERFSELSKYCIEHYFNRENYMCINGKIFFAVFNICKFADDLGGVEKAGEVICNFRKECIEKTGKDLYFCAVDPQAEMLLEKYGITVDEAEKILTIDVWTTHQNPGMDRQGTFPVIDYKKWIDTFPETYLEKTEKYNKPYNPCVAPGWDCSPRTVASDAYEDVGYPFCHIAVNSTPENFEISLKNAKEFMKSENSNADFMVVSSWNEWTEGGYLEPDEQDGYKKLEAIKKVFTEKK